MVVDLESFWVGADEADLFDSGVVLARSFWLYEILPFSGEWFVVGVGEEGEHGGDEPGLLGGVVLQRDFDEVRQVGGQLVGAGWVDEVVMFEEAWGAKDDAGVKGEALVVEVAKGDVQACWLAVLVLLVSLGLAGWGVAMVMDCEA